MITFTKRSSGNTKQGWHSSRTSDNLDPYTYPMQPQWQGFVLLIVLSLILSALIWFVNNPDAIAAMRLWIG